MFDPVSPKAKSTYLKAQANIPTARVVLIPYFFKKTGSNNINRASEI